MLEGEIKRADDMRKWQKGSDHIMFLDDDQVKALEAELEELKAAIN
jgi:hypothetical protein